MADQNFYQFYPPGSDVISEFSKMLKKHDPELTNSIVLTPTIRAASYFKACFCRSGRTLFSPQVFPVETFLSSILSESDSEISLPDLLSVLLLLFLQKAQTNQSILKPKHSHELGQLLSDLINSRLLNISHESLAGLGKLPEHFRERFSMRADRELPFLENISRETENLFRKVFSAIDSAHLKIQSFVTEQLWEDRDTEFLRTGIRGRQIYS